MLSPSVPQLNLPGPGTWMPPQPHLHLQTITVTVTSTVKQLSALGVG